MFSSFFLSVLLKNNLPTIIKYMKYLIVLSVLVFVGVFSYNTYKSIQQNAKEISDNKVLIDSQSAQLRQQETQIKDMVAQVQQLQESQKKTLSILKELSDEQKRIDQSVNTRKQDIDKAIKNIDKKNITQAQKNKLKSKVLINGLNSTYCELFAVNCKVVKK